MTRRNCPGLELACTSEASNDSCFSHTSDTSKNTSVSSSASYVSVKTVPQGSNSFCVSSAKIPLTYCSWLVSVATCVHRFSRRLLHVHARLVLIVWVGARPLGRYVGPMCLSDTSSQTDTGPTAWQRALCGICSWVHHTALRREGHVRG